MECGEIFKVIQHAVSDVPLLLIGSGSSAPFGLPGMTELGEYLISKLTPIYETNPSWKQFQKNIEDGQDLETALTDIVLPPEIIDDIRRETWELVSSRDIELYYSVIFKRKQISLAKLLKKFYQTHPQCVNIITTNYDRVIEYACDDVQIPVNNGFTGHYIKHYTGRFIRKNTINLVKVHGSLDFFKDAHDVSLSLPVQKSIPEGLSPEIITPGISKYRAVLKGTARQLLNECDALISQSSSYLCIGYGFNDEQIQENMISNIRGGKPIVVVTRTVSEKAANLLANNSSNYVSIQQGKEPNTSEFCINKKIVVVDGTYWTVDGLLQIID